MAKVVGVKFKDAGKLYYEGTLDSKVMPWKFDIHYYIDGKEYSPEEIVDLVCDIEFVHLYDALRDQAETVYAYSTDGDRSMTLKYRSRKLFDREAMLLS